MRLSRGGGGLHVREVLSSSHHATKQTNTPTLHSIRRTGPETYQQTTKQIKNGIAMWICIQAAFPSLPHGLVEKSWLYPEVLVAKGHVGWKGQDNLSVP